MKKLKFSQSGSALVQAMMGLGVVGMVSYSVMSYQSYSSTENRIQFAQDEIDSAAQMVSALIAIPSICNSNLSLSGNFVRPANLNDPAPDIEVAINLGLATSNRPEWVTGIMGPAAGTSIPGTLDRFNLQIDRIAISNARLKKTSPTNQVWLGDIILSAQKPNSVGNPAVTGRRNIGNIELEIDAAGVKTNCTTSASVATVCRDLGGVYDPQGVPNCVFAMKPMSCPGMTDGYVHNIDVNGNPDCRSATAECPPGYFANGITEGALNCTRLSRRIVYLAPPTPIPAPVPTSCTSATLIWTVGSETCSALANETLDTNNLSVTDSTPDPIGTATFACNSGQWSTSPLPGATCSTPAPPTPPTPPAPACVKAFMFSACKKASGKTACGYATPHGMDPTLACSGNIIAGGYLGPNGMSSWIGVGDVSITAPWTSVPTLHSYPNAKCVVHYKVGYSNQPGGTAISSIYYDGPPKPGALTTGKINSLGEALIKDVSTCL